MRIRRYKNEINVSKNSLDIEFDKVKETIQLLKLYLPKEDKEGVINEDHKTIHEVMEDVHNIINPARKGSQVIEVNNKLDKLTDDISAYLKQEWDRSKDNK